MCPKVNIIAQLEFDLAYFKAAAQHINLYVTGTPTPSVLSESKWCSHTIVLTLLQDERIPILFYQRDLKSI